ncbi:MAG: putative thiol-disulfide isomerase [Chitinophagaceae bacterium]|nr:putative thiol-disulfide isomerase [Chitinophagaceae bacterium]
MKQKIAGTLVLVIGTIALFGFTYRTHEKEIGKEGYKISFKIKGTNAADSIFLCRYYGDKRYYQDTAVAEAKGVFVFEGKEALPEGMYFVLLPGQKFFDVLVSNQTFFMESDTSNFAKYMIVKNSPDNKGFYEYQQFYIRQKEKVDSINAKAKLDPALKDKTTEAIKQIDVQMTDFIKTFKQTNAKSLFTSILDASEEVQFPEIPKKENGQLDSMFMYRYYKAHFFDKVNFSDDRLIRTPVLAPKIDRYFKDLVTQAPDSIIKELDGVLVKVVNSKDTYEYLVRTMTYKYETSEIMGMDAVFVHMGKNYYEKGKCPWATKEVLDKIKERTDILDPLLIGKKAPELYMADSTGKYVQLHKVQAKYTLVFFWDSNCGHCQKEVPKLFDLLAKLKPKGVAVYAANIERKDDGWLKFIRDKKLSDPAWFNVRDSHNHTEFKTAYDIYSTPVMYVLDANKKIIAKRITIDQVADFIDNYEKLKK